MKLRWVAALLLVAMFSGCLNGADSASDGEDGDVPFSESSDTVSLDETVMITGTGVPTVQCPADDVNTHTATWTIEVTEKATSSHVSDLVFTVQGEQSVNDVDMFVTGPDGKNLGSGTSGTNFEEVKPSGNYSVGDYLIEVRGCSGSGNVKILAEGVLHWTE